MRSMSGTMGQCIACIAPLIWCCSHLDSIQSIPSSPMCSFPGPYTTLGSRQTSNASGHTDVARQFLDCLAALSVTDAEAHSNWPMGGLLSGLPAPCGQMPAWAFLSRDSWVQVRCQAHPAWQDLKCLQRKASCAYVVSVCRRVARF